MAAGDNLGAKFTLDITNLKAGLADANKLIRATESEFIESAAALGDWSKSADGLTARFDTLNKELDIQKSKIQSLIAVRNETIEKMKSEGAASEDIAAVADRVNAQLSKEYKTMETLQAKADKAGKELEDFNKSESDAGKGADTLTKETTKAGNAAKKAGDGFTVFKGILSDLASTAIKGFANAITTGVSNIGKGIKKTVSDVTSANDEIAKSAQKAGFTSKTAFQEWQYVLERTGTDISSLNKGMIAISTASDKSKKAIEGLGVSFKDTNGNARANEDIFSDVITKLSGMTDETKKSQLAQQIFGKSFTELRPLLAGGADSVDELKKRAHELGVVLSDDVLKESENLQDSFDDFNASITGIKNRVVSGFMPSIKGVVDGLTQIFSGSNVDAGLKNIESSVGSIAGKLLANAPQFAKTAGVIVKSLLQAVSGSMPLISETLGQLINDGIPVLTQLLISAVPVIAGAIGVLLQNLGAQLPALIKTLFDAFGVIVNDLVTWINSGDNLQLLIDGLVKLCADLATNAGVLLESLLPAITQIITGVISALTTPENTELLINAALSLAKSVFIALVNSVPILIDFCKNLISNLAGLFADFLGRAVPFVADAIEKIVNTVKSWFGKLAEIPAQVVEIGKNIIRGIVEGMSDNSIIKWLGEKIKGIGAKVVDGLKSFFKIKSPSRLMRDEIGKNLALGIGAGFDDEMSTVARGMQTSLNAAIPTINASYGNAPDSGSETQAGGVVVYQTNNYSQAHSRFEIYQSKQATAAAVRAALAGG